MNGGRINENEAKVITTDPRYNLRIVATLESISIHSPMLHIRKPPTYKTLTDLIEDGMLTQQQAQQLAALVKERKSIVISGPPSSGKPHCLQLSYVKFLSMNAMLSFRKHLKYQGYIQTALLRLCELRNFSHG